MPARVLCVDSDLNLSSILEKSLRGEGYEVESVHDGESALEMLGEEEFDLALIDIQLPRRDGFEVLEQIRALPSPVGDIPVFLLTATRITPAYKSRARTARATAMLTKPLPLQKLHALVRKHVKEGPPRAVDERELRAAAKAAGKAAAASANVETEAPAPDPTAQKQKPSAPTAMPSTVALEGELRDLDFPSLLHHLHGLRATGTVVLTNARKRKVVQVREGYPVAVKSNLIGECFGNLLVQQGVISQDAFDESITRMKAGEGLQGQILVAMQAMQEEEVARCLLDQAGEKLLEIFEWKRGHYEFKAGSRLKGGIALPDDRSPAVWVIEGVRERMPIERIDRKLRKLANRFVASADSAFYRLQNVELDAVEKTLVDSLDGKQRVGSFLRSDEPVRRALYGLLVTGLLDSRDKGKKTSKKKHAKGEARPAGDERELRTELAASAERMRRQNDYEVLGVAREASVEDIEAAFEEVARRAHPDRFQKSSGAVRSLADEVFRRIEGAYERLSDPRARSAYDKELQGEQKDEKKRRAEERVVEAEVYFQRGEAHLRDRGYESALLCFGNALQRKPEEGEYHAHYGWCLFLIHQDDPAMVEEAIEHVKRGIKLARDNEKTYLFLGRLYKAIGKSDAAEKMFTRAVRIRPESVDALRELRLINLRRNKQGLIGRLLRR